MGEIGGIVRNAGYDVFIDGFSVCQFLVKGTWIRFYSDNCDTSSQWVLGSGFSLGDNVSVRVDTIDPNKEYDVAERLTAAEKFKRGDYRNCSFIVRDTNREIGEFSSFEKADEYAREACLQRINERLKDRSLTRYYKHTVVNDEQAAIEGSEIRHYPWYSYEGHEYYISIEPFFL